ncbi:hypothetical protein DASC09_032060 [Saccharomycopsis crataegensis]|uniref:Borealin N-terminal domain-containing protein n=1 Tax=Saccharomycopsis crataegensis TaxID=43959 RepID=A0AAV5QMS7_9ASCO|nr:hypothetical protein DASC09_032060 [Saccharomycopsis crataegensis]
MGTFTKEQKEKIVSKLRFNMNERIKKLRYEQDALVANLENKIKHRLNLVPKKYWDLKLRDVIELERHEKVNFATLLNAISTNANNIDSSTSTSSANVVKKTSKELNISSSLSKRSAGLKLSSHNGPGSRVKNSGSPSKSYVPKLSKLTNGSSSNFYDRSGESPLKSRNASNMGPPNTRKTPSPFKSPNKSPTRSLSKSPVKKTLKRGIK